MIRLPDDTVMSEVFTFFTGVLNRFIEWTDAIHEAIANNEGLEPIINLAAPVFENPIYIADTSFQMIASWDDDFGVVNPTWRYQQKYRFLPYQTMQTLIETGELDLIFNTQKAWLVKGSHAFTALPYISKSIMRGGVHYGNFFVIALTRHLDTRDIELADIFGDILSGALFGNKNYLQTSDLYRTHFIEEALSGRIDDEQFIEDRLRAIGWTIEGDYLLTIIAASRDGDAIRQHIMTILASELDAQCLQMEGDIVMIINDFKPRREQVLRRLESIARDFDRRIAIAEPFSDFRDIAKYYTQAVFILQKSFDIVVPPDRMTPDERRKRQRLFRYDDVFLLHIGELLRDAVPIYDPILRLRRYDEAKETDYCHTLYVWLANERNTVRAAQELFIHRNTLNNRLDKISEILGAEMDDVPQRIRVLLSLSELQRTGHTQAPGAGVSESGQHIVQ